MAALLQTAVLCALLACGVAEEVDLPAYSPTVAPVAAVPGAPAPTSPSSAMAPPPPAPAPSPRPPNSSAAAAVPTTLAPPAAATTVTATEHLADVPGEAEAEAARPECVHVGQEHCPPANELCRCQMVNGTTTTAVCCDVTALLQLKESLNCHSLGSNITAFHARNITLPSLDVSILNLTKLHLVQLESLAITDGHIVELKGRLEARNLACLNLSGNGLINVSENTFSSLHSLENLDLSGNDLQQVVNLNADVPKFKLDISGNNKLSCVSIMELMKHMRNLQFSHDNNTYCLTSRSFHWFNSTDKIPLSSVELLNKLEQECPHGENEACICSTVRLNMVPGKPPTFSVSVDCSNRRLTSLPTTLPKNTISLNVSSNNISDLHALSFNPHYQSIRMFYAADNQITSIIALEGSTFMDTFYELNLRSNNISSLPTYVLSNVFDRNWDDRTVRLGLNRLKCDCSTAQTIKMWLNANYKHIPDYTEVLCENMRERVFELDQNKVCTVQSDWTEYVYYLVAAEVLLLILLISKVTYDYWVFKTAGYLPWPASKMPKLPCDWVFES